MISMKDIAAKCGVSVATVSKALNNQKDIGATTKELIKQTAREMGYTVNAAAKALKTNRTYNLGVLFEEDAQSGLTHDYFSFVLDSFKRHAELNGYDITFINGSDRSKRNMSYLEHARYRRFDGVLVACTNFNSSEVIELVQEAEIPLVAVDYLYNNRISIISDNVQGMKDLLTFIHGMGHRNIAYIHGEINSVTNARLLSFYKTSEELELSIPDEYVMEVRYRDTEGAKAATEKLLNLRNPPTCILYPDDFASFGGIRAIKERGFSIPEDISIAGYDGIRVGRHMKPSLTTLWQDTEGIGSLAAKKLINLIEQPKTTLIQMEVVKGKVFPGESVRNLNKL